MDVFVYSLHHNVSGSYIEVVLHKRIINFDSRLKLLEQIFYLLIIPSSPDHLTSWVISDI